MVTGLTFSYKVVTGMQCMQATNCQEKMMIYILLNSVYLQSKPKVVGTLELYHVSPIPPNQCWKIFRFFQQKGKNRLIINNESGGRGEHTSCPKFFVWDCSCY